MKKIFQFIQDIAATFNNKDEGHSARKWSAFIMVCLTIAIEMKYTNTTNSVQTVIVNLAFVLLCLGLITAQDIIKFKGSDNDSK